jgi:hypothetical protein
MPASLLYATDGPPFYKKFSKILVAFHGIMLFTHQLGVRDIGLAAL